MLRFISWVFSIPSIALVSIIIFPSETKSTDVNALAGLLPRELPFAKSNYVVRNFRHAVALDERRAKFKANLWGRTSDEDAALAAPHRDEYLSKKKREKLKRQAEEQKNASLFGYGSSMVESLGGAVGSMTGSVTGAVGSVAGAVGSMGGYVANSVWYGNTTDDSLEARRCKTVDGSGVYPPGYEHEASTSVEVKQVDLKLVRKKRKAKNNEPHVVHAISGQRVERTETDVEGEFRIDVIVRSLLNIIQRSGLPEHTLMWAGALSRTERDTRSLVFRYGGWFANVSNAIQVSLFGSLARSSELRVTQASCFIRTYWRILGFLPNLCGPRFFPAHRQSCPWKTFPRVSHLRLRLLNGTLSLSFPHTLVSLFPIRQTTRNSMPIIQVIRMLRT
jgi:hypothetical protein